VSLVHQILAFHRPRDTRGFPGEHEEIKISASIYERRFVLPADLCDQRHRTMVVPGNLSDYVEIFHDLLDNQESTRRLA
jgi:hypothetical protein